ncbi:hypothetical protein [Streptomyces sp. NPDC093544]|uniref:hypothetical protein n=1 Tax=Streptomyces sp. NPDC093544 TaxID=3155200 RepID=UPI0034274C92
MAAIAGFTIYRVTSSDADQPLNVDFILGGGAEVNGKGDKLAIVGSYEGLAASSDGTVYLFTQEKDGMAMWRKKPSGAAERIPVTGLDTATAEQAAVAPDGSVYLAAGDLWRISPGGKATKVIDTSCEQPTPLATAVKEFCTGQVTGVTVTEDGSVYIGDQVNWGDIASYVHKLNGNSIELAAGRPPQAGESYKQSNPAVKNGINPTAGTKAKDVLVTDNWNSGWLASGKEGLYWRTGLGIVQVNNDGTLSPFVGAASPGKITEAKGPFESVGRALDAEIQRNASDGTRGDLAVVPGRGEVYYTEAGDKYTPSLEGSYRWRGVTSDSQKELIEKSTNGKLVYRVTNGKLAPVIGGVQAIAASDSALFVAVESQSGDDRSNPENRRTAVVQLQLPESK